MIEVPGVGDRGPRELSRQTLAEVIEPRIEELYSLVQHELRAVRLRGAALVGIVLTGGSSLMQGMVELGEEVFHMPVRVGVPRYAAALAEVFAIPATRRRGPCCGGPRPVKRGAASRSRAGSDAAWKR